MCFISSYWLDDSDAPYATFLSTIETYLHPESGQLDVLKRFAKRSDKPNSVQFKKEFREVIADPSVLPKWALFSAAEFSDGSEEAFLARIWRELYGDESPASDEPADRADT